MTVKIHSEKSRKTFFSGDGQMARPQEDREAGEGSGENLPDADLRSPGEERRRQGS